MVKLCGQHTVAGMENEIDGRRQPGQFQPDGLSHAAANPVANHGLAERSRGSEADARPLVIVAAQPKNDKTRATDAGTTVVDTLKIGPLQ